MAGDARPDGRDRLSACLLAFVPWLVLYFSVQALGPPRHPLFVGFAPAAPAQVVPGLHDRRR